MLEQQPGQRKMMTEPGKRGSSGDGENFQSPKRVKQEPAEELSEDFVDSDEILYGDAGDTERVEQHDGHLIQSGDTLCRLGLPTDIEDVMRILFELSPKARSGGDELNSVEKVAAKYSSKIKDISNTKSFVNCDHYQVAFLPFIMTQMFDRISELIQTQSSVFRDYFILFKFTDESIEFRCVSMRLPQKDPGPQTGNLDRKSVV